MSAKQDMHSVSVGNRQSSVASSGLEKLAKDDVISDWLKIPVL